MPASRFRRYTVGLLLSSALLILAACGTPGNVVVLLPNADGTVGAVQVQGKEGSQQLTTANQATALDGRGRVLTLDQVEIQRDFSAALAAEPAPAKHFVLYFKSDTTELQPASQATLPAILAEVQQRAAPTVVVIGHTDHFGAEDYNNDLARARAEAVSKYVQAVGVPAEMITVHSYGYHVPLIKTPPQTREPKNRRVEVGVR